MSRPNNKNYNAFFEHYVAIVKGVSLNEIIENHNKTIINYWSTIPSDKYNFSYSPNKWTIKQLFQHVIDTERILSYRILCIARGEKQSLIEFNENEYANIGHADQRDFNLMIKEWELLRSSNNIMFKSFSENELNQVGLVGLSKTSLKAIIYIIFGHALHHIKVIEERYII
jgi:uncharacterized damage-inducible protein DinB